MTYKKEPQDVLWYSMNVSEVLTKLTTNATKGLSEQEAGDRLSRYGENVLPEKKKESRLLRFFKHFNENPPAF